MGNIDFCSHFSLSSARIQGNGEKRRNGKNRENRGKREKKEEWEEREKRRDLIFQMESRSLKAAPRVTGMGIFSPSSSFMRRSPASLPSWK